MISFNCEHRSVNIKQVQEEKILPSARADHFLGFIFYSLSGEDVGGNKKVNQLFPGLIRNLLEQPVYMYIPYASMPIVELIIIDWEKRIIIIIKNKKELWSGNLHNTMKNKKER
jgi:hypothetical protein